MKFHVLRSESIPGFVDTLETSWGTYAEAFARASKMKEKNPSYIWSIAVRCVVQDSVGELFTEAPWFLEQDFCQL